MSFDSTDGTIIKSRSYSGNYISQDEYIKSIIVSKGPDYTCYIVSLS